MDGSLLMLSITVFWVTRKGTQYDTPYLGYTPYLGDKKGHTEWHTEWHTTLG